MLPFPLVLGQNSFLGDALKQKPGSGVLVTEHGGWM